MLSRRCLRRSSRLSRRQVGQVSVNRAAVPSRWSSSVLGGRSEEEEQRGEEKGGLVCFGTPLLRRWLLRFHVLTLLGLASETSL